MTFQNLSHYIHYYYLRLGVTYSQTENILSTNFIHIIKQRARRRGVGGFPHKHHNLLHSTADYTSKLLQCHTVPQSRVTTASFSTSSWTCLRNCSRT